MTDELIDYETADWFTDAGIAHDPYPFLSHLRGKCPIAPTATHGVTAVTGYDEALEIFRQPELFSACLTVVGPFHNFPEPLVGDDVSPVIDGYRHLLPMNQHMVTMDPPDHTRERALLMRLITPRRLKDNEGYIRGLADSLLDAVVPSGRFEFIGSYAIPLATMVIVDLLGVPEEDHEVFRKGFGLGGGATGDLSGPSEHYDVNFLQSLDGWFTRYIEDRRREPRDDVMSGLANATYPDGSTPPVDAVVRTASFLFAAGQETSARMLAQALRFLAEQPHWQDELRADPEKIPNFVEETLRIESPTKTDFRLARRAATVAGVDIAPGTPVALLLGAANHDPRRFDSPDEFRGDRPNAKEHVAFGRGIHSCPGAPLARAEGRISLERILQRTRNIRLSAAHHGPPGNHRYEYEPTWMLRAMEQLHIEFDPVTD
jgi:cytochrome P450